MNNYEVNICKAINCKAINCKANNCKKFEQTK